MTLYERCKENGWEQLLQQWDCERNAPLTPQDVAASSHQKVWWHCERGHSWQAVVASRIAGCGCPVCANRVIVAGYNDLATTHTHLAKQWHPTRNGDLQPTQVGAGYMKKVW